MPKQPAINGLSSTALQNTTILAQPKPSGVISAVRLMVSPEGRQWLRFLVADRQGSGLLKVVCTHDNSFQCWPAAGDSEDALGDGDWLWLADGEVPVEGVALGVGEGVAEGHGSRSTELPVSSMSRVTS